MKKLFLSTLTLLLLWSVWAGSAKAQHRNHWQIGVFGGTSIPLGDYREPIGQTKPGYLTGIFADRYFLGGNLGIGIDARFIEHPLSNTDTSFFDNGFTATVYYNAKRFRHIALALGPTYQIGSDRFTMELFVKGGVLLQQFPNYLRQNIYHNYGSPNTPVAVLDILRTANRSDRANAWMGLGGLRLNYGLTRNLGIFLQGDYLRTFGDRFLEEPSGFQIEELSPNRPPNTGKEPQPEKSATISQTFMQMANVNIGIKYIFGNRRNPRALKSDPPPMELPVAQVPAEAPQPATPTVAQVDTGFTPDVVVVVKDKRTGLTLSGVKIVVQGEGKHQTSFSNSNGEAEALTAAPRGNYRISGEKNGVPCTEETITPEDFEQAGAVIYKELLHDDPRFTLIGETVDCGTGKQMADINTILTNEATDDNMSQVSDVEGKFIYQLEQQADYNVVANDAGKYSQTERITTKGLNRNKTLYVTLELGVCGLEEGSSWVVKNILYDFDRSDIRWDATKILDNVAAMLKKNPTLRIELSSHTDSRGNDEYNLYLSQDRADAAVQYLVSRGIDRGRMVAVGYGERDLVNACGNGSYCTEEEHEQNRRTEIRVLDY